MTTAVEEKPSIRPWMEEDKETGEIHVWPHAGQSRVLKSIARFVFFLAGTQVGKTCLGPYWLYLEMLRTMQSGEDVSQGIGDYLAVTSTYDLFQQKMLPELIGFFVNILKIGRWHAEIRTIELSENLEANGKFWAKGVEDKMFGRIILRSAQSEGGLESSTARAAWLDEVGQDEFKLQAWEAVLRRLSLYQGRVLGTTTLYNFGWMKMEVYDKWKKGDKNFEVIQCDSTENPRFPQAEFDRAKASLPLWKFNMYYRGMYEKPAGMVYDSFDETQCVVDRFPIPSNWLWITGHDFGSANPATLMIAYDPGSALYWVVHEYMPGSTPVHQQVEHFKKTLDGRKLLRRAGGSHQEDDSRQNYTAHGWPISEPSINSVEVGIERVYALHKLNKIMVVRDCEEYLKQKMAYSYKLGDGYTVLDEIDQKSIYHLMDAERYALCGFRADSALKNRPNQKTENRW